MQTQIDVQHDPAERKYFALIDGREALLQYSEAGAGTLNFWRTYVPPELRGRGIADEIVRHALEDARRRNLRVIPSCWFVGAYVRRHPAFQDLMAGHPDQLAG